MAVQMLVPWLGYKPGDIVELGEAVDIKLILSGKAEKPITRRRDAGQATEGRKDKH
jgi:hypothetical protein